MGLAQRAHGVDAVHLRKRNFQQDEVGLPFSQHIDQFTAGAGVGGHDQVVFATEPRFHTFGDKLERIRDENGAAHRRGLGKDQAKARPSYHECHGAAARSTCGIRFIPQPRVRSFF